jgi:hypothetical protein
VRIKSRKERLVLTTEIPIMHTKYTYFTLYQHKEIWFPRLNSAFAFLTEVFVNKMFLDFESNLSRTEYPETPASYA